MSDLRGPEYAANLTAEGAVKRALVEFDGQRQHIGSPLPPSHPTLTMVCASTTVFPDTGEFTALRNFRLVQDILKATLATPIILFTDKRCPVSGPTKIEVKPYGFEISIQIKEKGLSPRRAPGRSLLPLSPKRTQVRLKSLLYLVRLTPRVHGYLTPRMFSTFWMANGILRILGY